jgi:hypothetical protein
MQKIDEVANGPLRQAFLNVLRTPGDYGENWVQFLVTHGLEQARADYVLEYWFNQPQPPDNEQYGYWQAYQPIEPIIRQGLIEAIDLARHLPIDSYWFNGAETVEVYLTRSPQQVTRITATPPSPAPIRPLTQLPHLADILVVKHPLREVEVRRDADPRSWWVTTRLRSD